VPRGAPHLSAKPKSFSSFGWLFILGILLDINDGLGQATLHTGLTDGEAREKPIAKAKASLCVPIDEAVFNQLTGAKAKAARSTCGTGFLIKIFHPPPPHHHPPHTQFYPAFAFLPGVQLYNPCSTRLQHPGFGPISAAVSACLCWPFSILH
jgi:hypothetical protein